MPKRMHAGVCLYMSEGAYMELACMHDCMHGTVYLSVYSLCMGYLFACVRKRLGAEERPILHFDGAARHDHGNHSNPGQEEEPYFAK